MRAFCWNYQGLGLALTVQVLKGHVRKYDHDMVYLMETKNNWEKVKKIRKNLKFGNKIIMNPKGDRKSVV